jgi:hypothetical protein
MADFKSQFSPSDPTIISGQRAATDENSVRIKADVSEEIYSYDPNANSLTLLATKLRNRRKVSQYLFHWLEKDRYPRFTEVATGANASQFADRDHGRDCWRRCQACASYLPHQH